MMSLYWVYFISFYTSHSYQLTWFTTSWIFMLLASVLCLRMYMFYTPAEEIKILWECFLFSSSHKTLCDSATPERFQIAELWNHILILKIRILFLQQRKHTTGAHALITWSLSNINQVFLNHFWTWLRKHSKTVKTDHVVAPVQKHLHQS